MAQIFHPDVHSQNAVPFQQLPQSYQQGYGNQQPEDAQPKNGLDYILDRLGTGGAAGIESGIASGIQKQLKQTALNKLLGNINPRMSPEEKLQIYANADPETREALKYYEDQRMQQQRQQQIAQSQQRAAQNPVPDRAQRTQIEGEKLFGQFAKNYLPEAVNDRDLEKKQAVLEMGTQLMSQGISPARAFSQAKTRVSNRYAVLDDLDKTPTANPGIIKQLFGEKKSAVEKKIKEKIARVRKSGLVSDEEIALKLLEKEYPPEFLQSLELNLGEEFQNILAASSTEAENAQPEMMQQRPQQAQPQQARQMPPQQQAPVQQRQQPQSEVPQGMPPPQQLAGKKLKDNISGAVYQSNGQVWVRVE